ncbi:type II toxin-antitoxin system HicA family toxin [bacterium]|nr:type II toxin-antitoxin system HicA family toxin [bacterium]
MTKQELTKILKKAGLEKQAGGRHEIWKKKEFPTIPRHAGDIPKGTAGKILKAAGIK